MFTRIFHTLNNNEGKTKMPELILIGFGTKDITIDLTGKTPEQAIEQAIEQANEKGKQK